jgi:hypothetical protein
VEASIRVVADNAVQVASVDIDVLAPKLDRRIKALVDFRSKHFRIHGISPLLAGLPLSHGNRNVYVQKSIITKQLSIYCCETATLLIWETPMTTTNPTDATGKPATLDGAYRGRRLSWAEFYRERPDLRPVNDNQCPNHDATSNSR